MATQLFSPPVAIYPGDPNLKRDSSRRVLMLQSDQIPTNKASAPLIKSFTLNKVFEDQSRGILCYRDAGGELICEGYDEGPRLCRPTKQKFYRRREHEIVDLLKQVRLQILLKEAEFRRIRCGVDVQGDFDDFRGPC